MISSKLLIREGFERRITVIDSPDSTISATLDRLFRNSFIGIVFISVHLKHTSIITPEVIRVNLANMIKSHIIKMYFNSPTICQSRLVFRRLCQRSTVDGFKRRKHESRSY